MSSTTLSAIPGSRATVPNPVRRPRSTHPAQIATNAGRHRISTGHTTGRRTGTGTAAAVIVGGASATGVTSADASGCTVDGATSVGVLASPGSASGTGSAAV